jgi:hypothetical protein
MSLLKEVAGAVQDTIFYHRVFWHFRNGAPYPQTRRKTNSNSLMSLDRLSWDTQACVVLFAMHGLTFRLWNRETYRNPTFQIDLQKNLRNVMIPGTGIPLSFWCWHLWMVVVLMTVVVPIVAWLGAMHKAWILKKSIVEFFVLWTRFYRLHLLHPPDWFHFWQINCRLATWHANVSDTEGYKYEDKWTFLYDGDDLGVPVSPFLKTPANLVVKDTNEEGGLGIHFYQNAVHGGRWILQEKMENSQELSKLLPDPCPLSTVRVITASNWWLSHQHDFMPAVSIPGAKEGDWKEYICPVSHVFRAGRKGAATDHSSILFDVSKTGEILRGTTNEHWYSRGRWCSFEHEYSSHPDVPSGTKKTTGSHLPDFDAMLNLVCESHWKMMRDVPLVGWDVAYTDKGVVFLEVNLSCNFFRGSFDQEWYFKFVDDYFRSLDRLDHAKSK